MGNHTRSPSVSVRMDSENSKLMILKRCKRFEVDMIGLYHSNGESLKSIVSGSKRFKVDLVLGIIIDNKVENKC